MNINVAIDNPGLLVWTGTTAIPRDTRGYLYFAFTFEVFLPLTADTIFNIMYHDPLPTDNCLPGPALPVPEVAICTNAIPGPQASITIPAGTTAGSICFGTIPCRPGAFISLAAVSGNTTNVRAVMTLSGPKF